MSVTTLKGTQWYIDSSPYIYSHTGEYYINFTSNENTYTKFKLSTLSIFASYIYYDSTNVYTKSSGSATWKDANYRTVVISDGADTQNSELLSFFNNEATLRSVTVYYDPGDYGTGTAVSFTKSAGASITLEDELFTRSGYEQDGWSVNSDGSTLDYDLEDTYSTDDTITLYPHWSEGASKAYVGVSNVAKQITKGYVGVNGTAKKITKGYVGVNGVAKQIF